MLNYVVQVIGIRSISPAHPQHEGAAVTLIYRWRSRHLGLNKEYKETGAAADESWGLGSHLRPLFIYP